MKRFTCSIPEHLVEEVFRLTNLVTGEIVEGTLPPVIQHLTRNGRDMLNAWDIWTLERVQK